MPLRITRFGAQDDEVCRSGGPRGHSELVEESLRGYTAGRLRVRYVMRQYFVYIMASRPRTLYIGVTRDLHRRVAEHRAREGSRFASRYFTTRLVYLEEHSSIVDAIHREKQLKGWRREKKVALIERLNPNWEDLGEEAGFEQ